MSTITQNEKSIEEQQQVFQNATITATKSAVKRLKGVMATDGKEDHFLRMSVEGGGCSGMTYKMDFENIFYYKNFNLKEVYQNWKREISQNNINVR